MYILSMSVVLVKYS